MELSAYHATCANPTNSCLRFVSVSCKALKTEQAEILLSPVFLCIEGYHPALTTCLSFGMIKEQRRTISDDSAFISVFLCLNYILVNFVFYLYLIAASSS